MKTKLNIELLKAIREKIATTPEAYDQGIYARDSVNAPCGTAACIAGWACVLSGKMTLRELKDTEAALAHFRIFDTAQSALGLEEKEARTLFTDFPHAESGWPAPFGGDWFGALRQSRAQIATAYLDHIIETGKVLE